MKITNTQVFGLEGSIISSRYPMMTETPSKEGFKEIERAITKDLERGAILENRYIDRADKLGKARQGTGHNNFLKGIIVQADVTASQNWWLQWGRYNFSDIVSSQSKMHRIMKMDLDGQCNEWVDEDIILILGEWIYLYNNFKEAKLECDELIIRNGKIIEFTKDNLFQLIVNNIPMGLELTARITDNYLSIKTQYEQRVKTKHPLHEWADWGNWVIEELPYFSKLTGVGK